MTYYRKDELLKSKAIHEAAHAVICLCLGSPPILFEKIVLTNTGDSSVMGCLKEVLFISQTPLSKKEIRSKKLRIEREIASSLAGCFAEAKFLGSNVTDVFSISGTRDLDLAKEAAKKLIQVSQEDDIQNVIDRISQIVEDSLNDQITWSAIEKVADELLKMKELTFNEVYKLLLKIRLDKEDAQ